MPNDAGNNPAAMIQPRIPDCGDRIRRRSWGDVVTVCVFFLATLTASGVDLSAYGAENGSRLQLQRAQSSTAGVQDCTDPGPEPVNRPFFDLAPRIEEPSLSSDLIEPSLDEIGRLLERDGLAISAIWEILLGRAVGLIERGDIDARQGNLAEALSGYEEAMSALRALASRDPANPRWQRGISVGHERIGRVHLWQGEVLEALTAFHDGLDIRRVLALRDPANIQLQRDVLVSLDRIGIIRLGECYVTGALTAFEEALQFRRSLAASDPRAMEWQRGLSTTLGWIGDVHLRRTDATGALAAYEERLEIARLLAARSPADPQWQRAIWSTLERIGDVRLLQGDAEAALAAYAEGLDVARLLASRDAENTEWQRDIALSLDRVGDVGLQEGGIPDALAAYGEGLEIRRTLVLRHPANLQWQRAVSASLDNIGDARIGAGDVAGALQAYQEASETRWSLSLDDPANADLLRDLMVSHVRLAVVAVALGKIDISVAYYRAATSMYQDLSLFGGRGENAYGLINELGDRVGVDASYSYFRELSREIDQYHHHSYRDAFFFLSRPSLDSEVEDSVSVVEASLLRRLSFYALLVRRFDDAREAAERATALAPGDLRIEVSLVHALMFAGDSERATALYLANRGLRIGDESWEDVISDQHRRLRGIGIWHPQMASIGSAFAEPPATGAD